ncbi:uncharacterized protein [Onthophagus taurus]|uniref:uncharacterized protein isoform X2 n=1 Tax=Onthophagus taurus TaxID=166361 RepID=UPI000C2027C7|nr:uncharacterized protein LOC111426244 [Onthophagus taurus]
MGLHSKTGLLPANKTISIIYKVKPSVNLKAVSIPAPYTLKPFAGLYNPYQGGCSLLCNHPADNQTKELLKKAKDAWATEGKPLLMVEEVAAIKKSLEQLKSGQDEKINVFNVDDLEEVPEELFRRYTETDSRPLTPAPTIISSYTKTSAATRRCVTPDPTFTKEIKEKTQLILDLRRSHSQETLSYFGGCSNLTTTEQSSIRIQQIPLIQSPKSSLLTMRDDCRTIKQIIKPKERINKIKPDKPKIIVENIMPQSSLKDANVEVVPPKIVLDEDKTGDEEKVEEDLTVMKRRGKKRNKKGRDASRGPLTVQTSIDPETQIATIGINSHNPSARPSLVSNAEIDELMAPKKTELRKTSLDINSYLDVNVLKQLRRELNEEVIENEFNDKRKEALKEALKTLRKNKTVCAELKSLQKQLKFPKLDDDFWLSLPRKFTRSSARFELPPDSRTLSKMTSVEYVRNHVVITSSKKFLYNHILNRNKTEFDLEDGQPRELQGKNMRKALNEMMGTSLNDEQFERFRDLIEWSDEDVFDFKTFCGICALCERLLGPEFCFLGKNEDPCEELEIVDFGSLEKRLKNQYVNEKLLKILYGIKNS